MPWKQWLPTYIFDICRKEDQEKVGAITLRLGNNTLIDLYAGHIGYTVIPEHRGHGYAEKACRLVQEVALEHGFQDVYITCDPDNIPSKRTIEKLGAKLLSVERVPEATELYRNGEHVKLRYVWKLLTEPSNKADG